MGGLLLGEYMMHSFGEYPNEERESLLSQILEDHPHLKYCLSAKACQGILNRAEKRGKELPEMLKMTLLKQSASKNEQDVREGVRESNTSGQEHCQPLTTKVYCLQGNGIDRAETAGCNGKGWRENQSYTLNTIDRPAVCCGVDAYNQTETGDKAMSITGAATDPHHIPCVTVSQDAYDKFSENTKSASLKACGGTYGGAAKY